MGRVVRQGEASGSAHAIVKAVDRRASYEWQYSLDGGKTWLQAPGTLKAQTVIGGLPVGATVAFRFRAITKKGEGDWSQAVSLVVK